MNSIAIIDYGVCNLDSIARAVDICGGTPNITTSPAEIRHADRVILPGVGAFPSAIKNLSESGMVDALNEVVLEKERPFLGVCLGMHLIAESSSEHGQTKGLGWIKGDIARLVPSSPKERIPHVGWNEVNSSQDHPLFSNIENGTDFYFVHSYHFQNADKKHTIATTPFCGGFVSSVQKDNIMGVQFHPEKSQKPGARLLSNFLSM